MGSTFNVRLTIVRRKVGRIKAGVDNKFVRHAVELTIDKAVIPLGSRYFTKKPRRTAAVRPSVCPRCCFIPCPAYSRIRPRSRRSHRESSLNHCPLISRRQRHRRRGVQEKESSSRLSSRFPLNFDSAFFLLAIGAPWNREAGGPRWKNDLFGLNEA